MSLDRSTINHIDSNLSAYRMAVVENKATPLELEVMKARLGSLLIKHADDLLRIARAHL